MVKTKRVRVRVRRALIMSGIRNVFLENEGGSRYLDFSGIIAKG
jgi:hypothetical protein